MTNLLIALGFAAFIVGAVAWMIKRSIDGGRSEERAANQDEVFDAIRDHQEVKRDVDALPADDARKRLQQWSRG